MSIILDLGKLRQESRSSGPFQLLEVEVSMGSMKSYLKTNEKEEIEKKMFLEDNSNHYEHSA